jgi:ribosomal protein L14
MLMKQGVKNVEIIHLIEAVSGEQSANVGDEIFHRIANWKILRR